MEKSNVIKRFSIDLLAVLLLGANVFVAFLSYKSGETYYPGTERQSNRQYIVSLSDQSPLEEPVSSVEVPLTEDQKRACDGLVRDMVTYYGCYGAESEQKVEELLTSLDGISAGQGELWRRIMGYWSYINSDFVVNEDSVPDGLSEGDNLCIIVLGQMLSPDGSISSELNGRLRMAMKCAEKYPNAWVMCTGGGTASRNKKATEAGEMCKWLLNNGLDSSRLIKEDKSKSTVENALNCYDILTRDYPQVDSVLLVSSRYHLKWGTLLFEASFLKSAKEKNKPAIRVVSNYAFPKNSSYYKSKYDLRWQAAGMFELIGDKERMDAFTYDGSYQYFMKNRKPEL